MSTPNSKSSTILILGAGSHARAVAELVANCVYPSVYNFRQKEAYQ